MRKYLRKTAGESYSHKFVSNWVFWLDDPTQSDMIEDDPEFWEDEIDEAKAFLSDAFAEDKSAIIEYFNDSNESIKIMDMTLEMQSDKIIATITYDREPTNDDLSNTADMLEGQYADGFGESLEQMKCTSVDIEAEDEDGEWYNEEGTLYIKLWPKNFSIKY